MWVLLTCSAFALAFIAWAVWFAKGLINTGVYGLLLALTLVTLYGVYSAIGYWGLVSLGVIGFISLSMSAAKS